MQENQSMSEGLRVSFKNYAWITSMAKSNHHLFFILEEKDKFQFFGQKFPKPLKLLATVLQAKNVLLKVLI